MSVYRTDNTYIFLTTVLFLVLSVLACSVPVPTTPDNTSTTAPTRTAAPTQTAEATGTVQPGEAVVIAGEALHVRASASERAVVIGYLYAADTVTLTGACRNGWAQIEWDGERGWVKAKYLSDNKCQTSEAK